MNAWQKKPFERAKNHLCHFLHTTPLFFCPLPLISPCFPYIVFVYRLGMEFGSSVASPEALSAGVVQYGPSGQGHSICQLRRA